MPANASQEIMASDLDLFDTVSVAHAKTSTSFVKYPSSSTVATPSDMSIARQARSLSGSSYALVPRRRISMPRIKSLARQSSLPGGKKSTNAIALSSKKHAYYFAPVWLEEPGVHRAYVDGKQRIVFNHLARVKAVGRQVPEGRELLDNMGFLLRCSALTHLLVRGDFVFDEEPL